MCIVRFLFLITLWLALSSTYTNRKHAIKAVQKASRALKGLILYMRTTQHAVISLTAIKIAVVPVKLVFAHRHASQKKINVR